MRRWIELPVQNILFRAALAVGTVARGTPRVNRLRTEVGLLQLGDASLALVPGELYPEIAPRHVERVKAGFLNFIV